MALGSQTASATRAVVGGEALIEVADVAIDSRSAGSEAMYTYRLAAGAVPGDAVVVPLGPRSAIGYVLQTRRVTARQLGFEPKLLRPITSVVEGARLPETLLDLLAYVAVESLSSTPTTLGLALPPGLKDRIITEWVRTSAPLDGHDLSAAQMEVIRVLEKSDEGLIDVKAKPMSAGAKRVLRSLKKLGLVDEHLRVSVAADRHRLTGNYRLTSNEQVVEDFLEKVGHKKPAQALLIMRLQGSAGTSFSTQELKALTGVTDAAVSALIRSGLLEAADEHEPLQTKRVDLNPHQARATELIQEAIEAHRHQQFLLFGVTGSGKTEVYLRCAEAALRQGRSVLYLVPEIALTAQVIAQLRNRFGRSVSVLHSNLPTGERLANWLRVASGEASVILGPRSALFAPIRNLGLIIMDEEHEGSYKQESSPRYHARDAAMHFAKMMQAPIVLGSATPSVESFFAADRGLLTRLDLPERAAQAVLPAVHLFDLTQMYKDRQASVFSPLLREKMEQTLARDEQVILFLNRRAFSPFLMCRECGHRFECPHCAVTLSYHKNVHRLRCHHCLYEEKAPDACPQCGGDKIMPLGIGAQRVEEAVAAEFEGARVARLDRDIVQRKGALEQTLADFRSQATNVLVGTQMVAKGLDFPNVTLVGVIAADISLNLPDFRASERTFQLLSQVAGRAGRGQRPGEVVIQTFSPENFAVRCAMTHDYTGFYEAVIAEREDAWYPPYCRLVNIVASAEDQRAVSRAIMEIAQAVRENAPEARVLGPVECPLERLNNKWRMHILIKMPLDASLEGLARAMAAAPQKAVSITVDVNPNSMM